MKSRLLSDWPWNGDPQTEPKYTLEEIEEIEANVADNKYDEDNNNKTQRDDK